MPDLRNPRFCGVELKPTDDSRRIFEGDVHSGFVRVWATTKGWRSSVYWSFYGVELCESLHAASPDASLRSLRGIICNLHVRLAMYVPKRRAKRG